MKLSAIFILCIMVLIAGCGPDCGNKDKGVCYALLAADTGDVSLCDKLSKKDKNKFNCYSNAAIFHEDPEICNSIEDQSEKNSCIYGIAKQNIEYCELTSNYEYCIMVVASSLHDQSLCENLSESGKCYRLVAVNSFDTGLCSISDKPDLCVKTIESNR